MSLILNIDTAIDSAHISLARDGGILHQLSNPEQKDHASWLHPSIRQLFEVTGTQPDQLDAVAVTIGPGSYTGLRVGLATAKGICYAANKPLIAVNSLYLIAFTVKSGAKDLIIPMIDARRMEVYTAVYDHEMCEKNPPHAQILTHNSFRELLADHEIIFCGNGVNKAKSLLVHPHSSFASGLTNAAEFALISNEMRSKNAFANLAYTEPLYVKEFHGSH